MKRLYKQDLETRYDARASFHGKAFTLETRDNTLLILYSYDRPIMIIKDLNKYFINKDYYNYSQTTLRHLKEFIRQYANDNCELNEVLKGQLSLKEIKDYFKDEFISNQGMNEALEMLNNDYYYFPF